MTVWRAYAEPVSPPRGGAIGGGWRGVLLTWGRSAPSCAEGRAGKGRGGRHPPLHRLEILKYVFADSRSIDKCADARPLAETSAPANNETLARHRVSLAGLRFDASRSNQDSSEPRPHLGVIFYGDTDIVSVLARSDKVRFFGFPSWQRTTRTRGEVTRYRKMDFARLRSSITLIWPCFSASRSGMT